MKFGFDIKHLSSLSHSLMSVRLGDLLVNSKAITKEQLEQALAEQKLTGHKLGAILLKQKSISFTQLYRRLALQYVYRVSALVLGAVVVFTTPAAAYGGMFGPEYQISRNSTDALQNVKHQGLFGSKEIMSHDISSFKKWTSVIAKYDKQLKTSDGSNSHIQDWKNMVDSAKAMSDMDKIEAVNSFINGFKYIEDIDNYGQSDYWATPLEFLTRGGDCEDYAIAKYASLHAMGFHDDQLRIAIVKDKIKNLSHAVLIVYVEDQSYILDNQNSRVLDTVSVTSYEPIFSINNNAWWVHKA